METEKIKSFVITGNDRLKKNNFLIDLVQGSDFRTIDFDEFTSDNKVNKSFMYELECILIYAKVPFVIIKNFPIQHLREMFPFTGVPSWTIEINSHGKFPNHLKTTVKLPQFIIIQHDSSYSIKPVMDGSTARRFVIKEFMLK